MKVCRRCGAPLRDTDRFCSQCGAMTEAGREEKRRRKRVRRQKREERKVRFRTASPDQRRNLDSFEEYENRSGALRATLRALAVIAVLTAAAVLAYLWHGRKGIFRQPDTGSGNAIVIQSEEMRADRIESELAGDLNRTQAQDDAEKAA